MVRSPDRLHSSVFLTGDFPPDRPASPAFLTVPLSRIYGYWANRFHRRYDSRQSYHAAVPVISVGNITVGGTGKTPFVIALAKIIAEMRPELAESGGLAILSRGYGRKSRDLVVVDPAMSYCETGDEPLLIKRAVAWAQVVVYPDRAYSARYAIEQLGAKAILLDDGFQHRRLARDLDIVLVDGQFPVGNGYLLPAGPLRENKQALHRATFLAGVGENTKQSGQLAEEFGLPFLEVTPQTRLSTGLSTNSSEPIFVFTSIARPSRFHKALLYNKLNIVGGVAFRDHHRFTNRDIHRVINLARQAGAQRIVTTVKDFIRIPDWNYDLPLSIVEIELKIKTLGPLRKALETLLGGPQKELS